MTYFDNQMKNMEAIKVALEAEFDYLDHPLAYKNVKD
jgi:hypothetical protein